MQKSEYEYDYGPVIPWSGGECPVEPDDIVDVVFRDMETCCGLSARGWDWGEGSDYAIIAYRVKKKKVPKVETVVIRGKLDGYYAFSTVALADTHKITLTKIDGEWQTEAKLEKL